MTRIAHIVNPVKVDKDNELYWQQPITFESMKVAQRDNVEIWETGYPEDPSVIGFKNAGNLSRSTLDMGFETKRKLPFFQDILNNLYNHSDADVFIQTNADIGVMPHFYDSILTMLDRGCDSLIINKRIVPDYYKKVEDLPLIYSEYGQNHNGYDCFVFRREIYPQFDLGDICMGTPWSETTLTMNMIAYSKSIHVLKYPHLTFHMGDSRTWMKQHDYRKHNTEEFGKVVMKLMPKVIDSPITHWLLWKLSQEIRPSYSIECHKAIARLNSTKLNEYQKAGIVAG